MGIKAAIIIGGSGYIGRNLLSGLMIENLFEKYFVLDINPLKGFEKEVKEAIVTYISADVRRRLPSLEIDLDGKKSWIFNMAAIHREPGHEFKEYFDTNIPGAKHVNLMADELNISNVFFTSSIAPYGKSIEQRTEQSTLYPETAYGISKALAEEIHQKWLNRDILNRRLVIVRPSVIYGPKDPGNVYRMIKSLKKGTFILPNGGQVIKAYGYVYGLVDSILFTIQKEKEPLIVYNYAENPLVNLKEMTQIVKKELDFKKLTLSIPVNLLVVIARLVQIVFKVLGKKSDIHPVRVRKAGFPTNIHPEYLINSGFSFKYGFEKSLKHWKSVSPEDFD